MTSGAIAARERRINEWEMKRFNVTLKEYLEVKHSSIYNEYCTFYNSLMAKHPNKRNLLATTTFRTWKKNVIEQTFKDDGLLAKVTYLTPPEDSTNDDQTEFHASASEVNDDLTEFHPSDSKVTDDQTEFHTNSEVDDILSAAIDDTLSGCIHQVEDVNIEDVDNIIDEIIGELERDGAMHEINNDDVQQDDEGIALDYQTELEAVIEPFDYELEIGW